MSGKQLIKRLLPGKKNLTSVDVLTGYAEWAKTYPPTAHNPLMEIEQQAMLSLLPADLSAKTCLDLACGSGRYLRLMQQRGTTRIFGTDYSPEMLARAGQPSAVSRQWSAVKEAGEQRSKSHAYAPRTTNHTQSPNLQSKIQNPKLIRAPFFPLPFADGSFDLVTCGLAVGHERNLSGILAEVARVLRPAGALLYSDFHPFGALLGWQRTFTAESGKVFSLEYHLHLYSHHQQACRAAGLTIEAVLEPLLGEHGPAEFQQLPAVLVIKAVKE